MFDPINGPAHPGQLPSTNDSTENGDSWHAAVVKVNGMFKALFGKLEAPIEHVIAAVDDDARKAITALEEEVAVLQQKIEAMTKPPAAPPAQPAEPAPAPVTATLAGTAGVAAVTAALETPAT